MTLAWKKVSMSVLKSFHPPMAFELRTYFPLTTREVASNMEMTLSVF